MPDDQKTQSGGDKSPEDELNALLRQAGARPIKTGGMGMPSPVQFVRPKALPKINWLAITIGVLTLVLVFGTGYFLLMGVKLSTGTLTFELNQEQVSLRVDDKGMGEVSDGSSITLKTGEHIIKLAKEGFLELERTVIISRQEEELLSVQILPIPTIERLVDGNSQYARLSRDGGEVSYYDPDSALFKTVKIADKTKADLFRGSFKGMSLVAWSPIAQTAMVKLAGQPALANAKDNRGVKGRYVVLGERPIQGAAKNVGTSTWLFDDSLKTSIGWQPVLLNESIRQVAFSGDGSEILYIYDTSDGEYSLVRSLPDGEEWERVIVDFPKLGDCDITWGADDRFALLTTVDGVYEIDLVSKSVDQIMEDWVVGTSYSLSPDGSTVAYLSDNDGSIKLKTYSLTDDEAVVLSEAEVDNGTVISWLSSDDLLLAKTNQMFVRFSVETQDKMNIPFSGTEIDFQIKRMEYSGLGQVLMLDTNAGLFVMKM